MRSGFFMILLAFALGAGVGDRYGLPGFAKAGADAAFGAVEGWVGKDAGDDAASPDEASAAPAGDSPNATLTINEAGLDIIRESEGLRLEAYRSGAQWLIGYGHSRTARQGMSITEAEADALLRADVADSESAVRKAVRVRVNRNQFSAMVSLAYNLGERGFMKTFVLERVNAGDFDGAAEAFLLHDRARVDGELRSIAHLTERRKKERALFLH